MADFFVGQKVVCVDDAPSRAPGCNGDMSGLTRGCVYTVREVGLTHCRDVQRRPCVRLYEIVRPRKDDPYLAIRFRPVRETNIDVFTAMLAPTPRERVHS